MTPPNETRGDQPHAPYIDDAYQQRIRPYITQLSNEEAESYFTDVEHAIEQLAALGKDPQEVLAITERIGRYLTDNSGANFTADYQILPLSRGELWAVQLPGGGNIYLIHLPEGDMVIDTGYGCCYHDAETMLKTLGIDGFSNVKTVVCTHADADHCGASGYLPVPPLMHPVTREILEAGTRGFGSATRHEDLERTYTTTINTFSGMHLAENPTLCATEPRAMHGLFPVIDDLSFGGLNFEIWESLGGHIAGQIFLYEKTEGLLFTSDALINFTTMTKERKDYCSIADYLVTSVNVNSAVARTERHELMRIAKELNEQLSRSGKKLLIACGHGAVSILDDAGALTSATALHHYAASGK